MTNNDEMMTALHPDPEKQGTRVTRTKYEAIKAAMLAAFDDSPEILFKDLSAAVESHLEDSFEGSVGWWTTTVKLDLEARGLLERANGASPQQLRRSNR